MIQIAYNRGEPRLSVRGHAGAGAPGHDIVCAGVSALVYALAFQVETMGKAGQAAGVRIVLRPGYAEVGCTAVEKGAVRAAFDTAAGGLRLIANNYRKNVRFWG